MGTCICNWGARLYGYVHMLQCVHMLQGCMYGYVHMQLGCTVVCVRAYAAIRAYAARLYVYVHMQLGCKVVWVRAYAAIRAYAARLYGYMHMQLGWLSVQGMGFVLGGDKDWTEVSGHGGSMSGHA